MSLPDINNTIAAALYGAAAGVLATRKAGAPTEDAVQAPAEPTADLGKDWQSAPAPVRAAFLKMARFLNSYSHGQAVAKLDREQATLALVDHAKGLPIFSCGLPYGVLISVFVAVRQSLD